MFEGIVDKTAAMFRAHLKFAVIDRPEHFENAHNGDPSACMT